MVRPLLLLDVDGPLNPWAAKADAKPAGYIEHRFKLSRWSRRKPLRMWLNPDHGAALLQAANQAELVWATTWEHQANTMVGPAIGLPPLPVIHFGETSDTWKFAAVLRYAAGRPLVWLDNDFDMYSGARDSFLAAREAAGLGTELVRVDPHTGITAADLAAVRAALC
jgi:hypothetical protein